MLSFPFKPAAICGHCSSIWCICGRERKISQGAGFAHLSSGWITRLWKLGVVNNASGRTRRRHGGERWKPCTAACFCRVGFMCRFQLLCFSFLGTRCCVSSLPGFRYLCSLVETILIYQHFTKPCVEQPSPRQELLDFWMDFLVEATKQDVSSVRFPVSNLARTLACGKNGSGRAQVKSSLFSRC